MMYRDILCIKAIVHKHDKSLTQPDLNTRTTGCFCIISNMYNEMPQSKVTC